MEFLPNDAKNILPTATLKYLTGDRCYVEVKRTFFTKDWKDFKFLSNSTQFNCFQAIK